MVLEKKPSAGTKRSCTGLIGAECLRLFPSGSVNVLAQYNSAIFYSPSGRPLRVDKPRPQAYMVDRFVFDNHLAETAQKNGATYCFNTFVDRIETGPDSVRITAVTGGRQNTLHARMAVIAGGSGSRLPETLGLGRLGSFVRGCQTEVSCTVPELEVYLGRDISPGFFGWLAPFAPGHGRLGLLTQGGDGSRQMANLWQKLNSAGKVVSPLADLNYGAIPLKRLSRTYANRVLVVGDAAGQVKPTTGGGIYYGLLCASMAADCIHDGIVQGDLSSAHTRSYEKRWRRALGAELTTGNLARAIWERLGDKQMDRIFDIVLSHGIHRALLDADDFSFDWHGRLVLRALKYKVIKTPLGLFNRLLAAAKLRDVEAVRVMVSEPES